MSDSAKASRNPRSVEKRERSYAPKLGPRPICSRTLFRRMVTPSSGYAFRPRAGRPDELFKKLREGWEPVPSQRLLKWNISYSTPTPLQGNVEVGGLLLCRMPEGMAQQRNEYYQRQSEEAMRSVDNTLMRDSDPRMPISSPQRDSRVSLVKAPN